MQSRGKGRGKTEAAREDGTDEREAREGVKEERGSKEIWQKWKWRCVK